MIFFWSHEAKYPLLFLVVYS